MQLSIIIPVYNVEQYIRSCIESIYKQGLDDSTFEVILVNDGTRDDSFGRISDIISDHSNVVVIEQPNQGLSAARNMGLSRASGQYILFVDSDDLLIDNTLKRLLALTNDNPVDLIIAGFIKMNSEEVDSYSSSHLKDFSTERKTGAEIFLHDFNPQQCYVWRTIYYKKFLDDNNLRFIQGIYFEDVPFTTECLIKAKDCIKTTLSFYIYRQRENSIVSSISLKKILDFNTVIARLWEMYKNYSLPVQMQKQLMNTIFTTYSISVWYVSHDSKLLSQRKTIVSDLKAKVPDLCFTNGIKQKIVSFCFCVIPGLYIKFRSLL